MECTGTSAGLYSETVTLSAQTYDSNGPDLSMLGITNSDITNSVSGQTFGGLNWKLGASYGGIDGSLSSYSGSAFSSAVGTGTTSSATSGNGNWRLLGTMQYTVTQLGNWKIASNFLLSANSISLANIFGHNIQFKIVITCVFSSGSGTTDGSQVSPPLTQTLILGNGQGATQENPTSQMNTWIVVTPGCILTGSNQCTSTNTYNG